MEHITVERSKEYKDCLLFFGFFRYFNLLVAREEDRILEHPVCKQLGIEQSEYSHNIFINTCTKLAEYKCGTIMHICAHKAKWQKIYHFRKESFLSNKSYQKCPHKSYQKMS